jgi:hypothetical protein
VRDCYSVRERIELGFDILSHDVSLVSGISAKRILRVALGRDLSISNKVFDCNKLFQFAFFSVENLPDLRSLWFCSI